MSKQLIGIVGAGAMGAGIGQVAAVAGHPVVLFDVSGPALEKAKTSISTGLAKLAEKGRISLDESKNIFSRIKFTNQTSEMSGAYLVLEAVIESLEVKQKVFLELEKVVPPSAVLATNTSSLSVTSIASVLKDPSRFLGIHFFNPAPLMPLVEVIPGLTTRSGLGEEIRGLMDSWGKVPVLAKDTPGFIVNRVARPFYGEAIRIYEEGFADFATIDWAMKEFGGFKMGPFELMDLIGNDVNYAVTETVWKQFYNDPRYRPSLTQKRLVEAKLFGRKSEKGYYDYSNTAALAINKDSKLGQDICWRVLVMLINEAADALYYGIASREDIDLAMTKGVNYPKGLLKWADEKGIDNCLSTLEGLYTEYGEDRYRPSVQFRKMKREGKVRFYE